MVVYHLHLRGSGLTAREDRPGVAGLWAHDNADVMTLLRGWRQRGFYFAVRQEYFSR